MSNVALPQCRSCRFVVDVIFANGVPANLECHRNPPHPGGFPTVSPVNWCGDYVAQITGARRVVNLVGDIEINV